MKTPRLVSRASWGARAFVLLSAAIPVALAAPPGPTPQIPEGGGPPGPFPNTSVSAVNVIAKGSSTFSGAVDVPGFEGQGQFPGRSTGTIAAISPCACRQAIRWPP
ncbi:MAG: hypothetical protein M5U12_16830 [Verrucomicrobia bacterium]|nr:hypothetical protein [Verrucomicrobiota bacterium]